MARVSDTIGNKRQREFTIAVLRPRQAQGTESSKKAADQTGTPSVEGRGSRSIAAGSSNPPPCRPTAFRLEQYANSRTGELIWQGVLSSGFHFDIVGKRYKISWDYTGSPIFQGSIGDRILQVVDRLLGDPLPTGIPVRVSVSPEVRLTTAPSAANCWASHVVLEGRVQVNYVRIKWEVFQP